METFDYLSRDDWGARPPRKVRAVLGHQFPAVEFHHSATGVMPAARAARSFQDFHMDTKHWLDLFYNWLVHPDGTIIEGRGWGTSPRPENFMTICFIGDYTQDQVTQAAKDSAGVLVRECQRRMPQLVGRDVRWHNQRASTGCPGKNLVSFIKEQNLFGWAAPVVVAPPILEDELSEDEWSQLAAQAFAVNYKLERRANHARQLLEDATVLYDELAEVADLSGDHLNVVRRLRKEYSNG